VVWLAAQLTDQSLCVSPTNKQPAHSIPVILAEAVEEMRHIWGRIVINQFLVKMPAVLPCESHAARQIGIGCEFKRPCHIKTRQLWALPRLHFSFNNLIRSLPVFAELTRPALGHLGTDVIDYLESSGQSGLDESSQVVGVTGHLLIPKPDRLRIRGVDAGEQHQCYCNIDYWRH